MYNEDEEQVPAEPMKITLSLKGRGCSGHELAEFLRKEMIECEYADPDYVVLMPTPSNKKKDFRKLIEAMTELEKCAAADIMFQSEKLNEEQENAVIKPEKAMSIRQAMFSEKESLPAHLAAGRVLADAAISCPPAVPVIICGERIDSMAVKLLEKYKIEDVFVVKE